MSEIEIWKDIPEYENLYQVSNFGKVKSLNYRRSGKERILKPSNDGKGYVIVDLYKNGEKKHFKVHQLVALAFIPNDNPIEKIEINHKDENKQNNHVDNLCWCSHIKNINYGTRNERVSEKLKDKFKDKENHPMYRKHHTEEAKQKMSKPILQFTLEGIFVRYWDSATTASRELNLNQGSICMCCKGKRNKCGEFIWKYKE